jgi:hypothetical protein
MTMVRGSGNPDDPVAQAPKRKVASAEAKNLLLLFDRRNAEEPALSLIETSMKPPCVSLDRSLLSDQTPGVPQRVPIENLDTRSFFGGIVKVP